MITRIVIPPESYKIAQSRSTIGYLNLVNVLEKITKMINDMWSSRKKKMFLLLYTNT